MVMIDKGYPYPLLSLNLLGPHQDFPDEPIYNIATPQGCLVVDAVLRKRAMNITTCQTWNALSHALAAHSMSVDGLVRYGLDDQWAQNMMYWGERLYELDDGRGYLNAELFFIHANRRELRQNAVSLWRQIALTAKLAQLEPPVSGPLPRGLHELLLGLGYAQERLAEPGYAVLAERGFGEPEQRLLARLLADLRELPAKELRLTEERRKVSAKILVVRGALLGDLSHLSAAARVALTPALSRDFQMEKVLNA